MFNLYAMQPASHYETLPGRRVRCLLCPHRCLFGPGEAGKCLTRVNKGGKLYSRSYGILSAMAMDPIEKKPLYHFYPGAGILSVGSLGCNFSCDFCQNCQISQPGPEEFARYPSRSPVHLVEYARSYQDNIGIAYTYNEPTVYFEYMLDCARLAGESGMKNVVVSNGYINREPLEELLPHIHAFNIDLKSIRQDFYLQRSAASVGPVLKTIQRVAEYGAHLELTFLMIPGYNDTVGEWEEMIDWIAANCGRETVLHVSRYFPRYKLNAPTTPGQSIKQFLSLAGDKLDYVYPGNLADLGSNTYCPACGQLLIERIMYHTRLVALSEDGSCRHCGHAVKGIFNSLQHEQT